MGSGQSDAAETWTVLPVAAGETGFNVEVFEHEVGEARVSEKLVRVSYGVMNPWERASISNV